MTTDIDGLEAYIRDLYFEDGEEEPRGAVPMDAAAMLAIIGRVHTAESECDALAQQAASLRAHLSTCHHHACYSIGEAEALARQLAKIREVANAGLGEQGASPLDRWLASRKVEVLDALATEMADEGDRQRLQARAAELRQEFQG